MRRENARMGKRAIYFGGFSGNPGSRVLQIIY
jgi:hypothetical protein